jgi:arylsulfatase A-like enzyme
MSTIARRDFLRISGTAGAGLALWGMIPQARGKSASRPNILVFLTDDHGQWAQRAYGNSELITPNLDRLAASGTRMMQAFTTCPVCSPARASFFTGRMPSQHGVHDWLMDKWINESRAGWEHPWLEGQTLLPELLKNAGYHTAMVGKWHCGVSRVPPRGFDRWFSHWVDQYPHRGEQRFSDDGKLVVEEGQQSPMLTRRCVEFLKNHAQKEGAQGKPFFLCVGYVDTHTPHKDAQESLVERYQSATFRDISDEQFVDIHDQAGSTPKKNPEQDRLKRVQYYAAVSSIDQEIGKLLEVLKASGQLENTLVVYTSDHGYNCGHHGIWGKGNGTVPQNFLEESTLVPCTVSWPAGGIREGAVCKDLVNHCDTWATLLDAAGAKPAGSLAREINSPGVSYLRQLRGQRAPDWRRMLVAEYGNARMARTERFKLVKRYAFGGAGFGDEFYDLEKDPRERLNRHDDDACRQHAKTLTAALDQFFARYTVTGNSGLELASQHICNEGSPWTKTTKGKKTVS